MNDKILDILRSLDPLIAKPLIEDEIKRLDKIIVIRVAEVHTRMEYVRTVCASEARASLKETEQLLLEIYQSWDIEKKGYQSSIEELEAIFPVGHVNE